MQIVPSQWLTTGQSCTNFEKRHHDDNCCKHFIHSKSSTVICADILTAACFALQMLARPTPPGRTVQSDASGARPERRATRACLPLVRAMSTCVYPVPRVSHGLRTHQLLDVQSVHPGVLPTPTEPWLAKSALWGGCQAMRSATLTSLVPMRARCASLAKSLIAKTSCASTVPMGCTRPKGHANSARLRNSPTVCARHANGVQWEKLILTAYHRVSAQRGDTNGNMA